ncbi:hypothetical protein B0I00_2255 [Novosphingobium kunmingense]|uniref:Uncharacterized protein n=2 Tax=Novosphingobium kunmingense TaxID=1211806 RepID=A0A2N0H6V7_9SPHN|nr:hypothetical protein B0I00_2255 [Novosphingobium kunmingense]
MEATGFASRHRWDSAFWLLFAATSWLAVAMGFSEPVRQRFAGEAPYVAPPILVAHVFVYFGWLVLLSLQVSLIARRRPDLHGIVGVAGAMLAVLVVITGFGAEVYSQRFWAQTDPENVRFFTFPLYVLIAFAICAALAIRARADSPSHKRLMFMATTAIMGGPYQRWWGGGLDAVTGTGPFNTWVHYYFAVNLLLAIAALYDRVTRGAVHRVLRIGIPLLVAGQVVAVAVWYSDWWPPFTRAALGIATP